jgi:hypothetical protein
MLKERSEKSNEKSVQSRETIENEGGKAYYRNK